MPTEVVEVHPDTKKWYEGGRTYTGLLIVIVPVLLGLFGIDVREAFPVEVARFSEELIILVGSVLAFYGRWKAKTPAWFTKRK